MSYRHLRLIASKHVMGALWTDTSLDTCRHSQLATASTASAFVPYFEYVRHRLFLDDLRKRPGKSLSSRCLICHGRFSAVRILAVLNMPQIGVVVFVLRSSQQRHEINTSIFRRLNP